MESRGLVAVTDSGEMRVKGKKARNLIQATTWLPYSSLPNLNLANYQEHFDPTKGGLRSLLKSFLALCTVEDLGEDPRVSNETNFLKGYWSSLQSVRSCAHS